MHSQTPGSYPPHQLRLRLYAPVILLRHLDPSNDLCNGTRLIIIHMDTHWLRCQIISGRSKGKAVCIPRLNLAPSETDAIRFTRLQFPVKLAFGITINKCQGQTMKNVGIDLRHDTFSHGQLYVALSRTTSFSNLRILPPDDTNRANLIIYEPFLQ